MNLSLHERVLELHGTCRGARCSALAGDPTFLNKKGAGPGNHRLYRRCVDASNFGAQSGAKALARQLMTLRYKAAGAEAEFEPGSRGRVLRNLLGIVRVRDMDEAESQALEIAQEAAIEKYGSGHTFSGRDVRELHRLWLGPIYPWAGEYRTINIGKSGFQFAHAPFIARLMRDFERGPLRRHTPCRQHDQLAVAQALAEVHAELILIHPFRDGNGRLARLLALLMALQAGLPPLDFSPLTDRGKRPYIAAIHAAMGADYTHLRGLFLRIIDRSQRLAVSSRR